MKIAILKPDYGIHGGFERLLDEIARRLITLGHSISWRTVQSGHLSKSIFGTDVDESVYSLHPEFFRYASFVDQFSEVDCSRADLVLSSQPPSFAVSHPRHLSIFYHHCRIFYDLADEFAAHFPYPEVHAAAVTAVRQLDTPLLECVTHFLAGSNDVAARLRTYNGLSDNVTVFSAGSIFGGGQTVLEKRPPSRESGGEFEQVLCVSRHEFPKRTELFAHAMACAPELPGVSVGTGGQRDSVMAISGNLTKTDPWTVNSGPLWHGRANLVPTTPIPANVRFLTNVSARELDYLYRNALCVVAPSLKEDYGLTAVEAMSYGKPLIVCSDGGALTEFVEHEVSGLIVEPTGQAIAEACRRLAQNPDMARQLGQAALQKSLHYTWDQAERQLVQAIDRVMS